MGGGHRPAGAGAVRDAGAGGTAAGRDGAGHGRGRRGAGGGGRPGRRPAGRGGGYYDRALAHARAGATVVALVFDDEFVDDLPAEPHDRRVDAVVTPSGGWQTLP